VSVLRYHKAALGNGADHLVMAVGCQMDQIIGGGGSVCGVETGGVITPFPTCHPVTP
jgi:hypothetical protein